MLNKFPKSRPIFNSFKAIRSTFASILIKYFSFLNNFRLKTRVMVTFLTLSILPFLLVGTTSYFKSKAAIKGLAQSSSSQVVLQIAENVKFATKYYEEIMTQFIIDPKVKESLWRIVNVKDNSTQKLSDINYIESRINTFLASKGEISTITISVSNGVMIGNFPSGFTPVQFFDSKGRKNVILQKVVAANAAPVWISPREWLEYYNIKKSNIVICRSINGIDNSNTIVLIMELKSYRLNDLCNPNIIRDKKDRSLSFITDSAGNIVSYNDENEIGHNADRLFKSKDAFKKILENNERIKIFNAEFTDFSAYVSTIDIPVNNGWKLVNVVDRKYLYRGTNEALQFTILAGIICILFTIIISLGISLNVSSAVLTVAKGLSDIAEGGEAFLNTKLPITSKDEIKDLVIAFNKIQDLEKDNIKSIKENQNMLLEAMDTLKSTQVQLVQSEKMASLGSLVAGVAHEINTPVGISVTAASHLQTKSREFFKLLDNKSMKKSDFEKFAGTLNETVVILLKNLERASDLIKSFKQVAVDQTSEEKRLFNIRQYLDEIILSLRPSLKKTKINVEIHCPDIEIKTYPGSVSQIITNLVMNSLVHAFDSPDEGTIRISVSTKESNVILVFEDNGKGIEKEAIHKIFEPFYTTKRGKGGTGLGLHLVYNIVSQKLGGTIQCQSEAGKGVIFLIEFPFSSS